MIIIANGPKVEEQGEITETTQGGGGKNTTIETVRLAIAYNAPGATVDRIITIENIIEKILDISRFFEILEYFFFVWRPGVGAIRTVL
jgi:hypothetical protein